MGANIAGGLKQVQTALVKGIADPVREALANTTTSNMGGFLDGHIRAKAMSHNLGDDLSAFADRSKKGGISSLNLNEVKELLEKSVKNMSLILDGAMTRSDKSMQGITGEDLLRMKQLMQECPVIGRDKMGIPEFSTTKAGIDAALDSAPVVTSYLLGGSPARERVIGALPGLGDSRLERGLQEAYAARGEQNPTQTLTRDQLDALFADAPLRHGSLDVAARVNKLLQFVRTWQEGQERRARAGSGSERSLADMGSGLVRKRAWYDYPAGAIEDPWGTVADVAKAMEKAEIKHGPHRDKILAMVVNLRNSNHEVSKMFGCHFLAMQELQKLHTFSYNLQQHEMANLVQDIGVAAARLQQI